VFYVIWFLNEQKHEVCDNKEEEGLNNVSISPMMDNNLAIKIVMLGFNLFD
jgi:hypothetical protein